jgi:hypothetical protein
MSNLFHSVIVFSLLAVSACSDYATFVTGTSIGITANANTEQVQIGYTRAELFQGPAYPDVGDAPPIVGFLGSDLAVFSPHVRQLYATGDAARLVTMHDPPRACPSGGSLIANGQPTLCAEKIEDLAGERRPMVFGTGSSVGLNLGFIGNLPSSIKLGYDREELSIIPFHAQAPSAGSKQSDKYSSALASLNLNVTAPNLLGSDLQITQFFATGAAARNLAKLEQIRNYFADTAGKAVAVVSAYEPDNNSKCIRDWRGSPADATKIKLINDKSKSLGADIGSFLDNPQFAADRASFVKEHAIKCV